MLSPILGLELHRFPAWVATLFNENPLLLFVDVLHFFNEGPLFQKDRPGVISVNPSHVISVLFVLSLDYGSFELRQKQQMLIFQLLVQTQDAKHAPLFHVIEMVQNVVQVPLDHLVTVIRRMILS